MKVTQNVDGTIDLMGIPEKTAYALMALLGNVSGGIDTTNKVWDLLNVIFPKYRIDGLHYKYPVFDKNFIWLDKRNLDLSFTAEKETQVSPAKLLQPLPRRDASGRFEKKVWVARFDYPDSNSSRYYPTYIRRTVITNLTGKRRPNDNGISIEGVDLVRQSFRKFLTFKIRGNVKWTKEYQSDVR